MINPKQEIYAQQRALGLSQAEAYAKAYPGTKPGTRLVNSTRLEARPDIRQRIADLQAQQFASNPALLTKDELGSMISSTLRALHNPDMPGFFLEATPMIAQYCKMYGFHAPDRIEASIGLLSDAERDAKIAALVSRRKH